MFKYLPSQIIHYFLLQGSSPYNRFLRYSLILLAAIWSSFAIYYYLNDDCDRSYAALISGTISFMLALISLAWDIYAKQHQLKTNKLVKFAMENSASILLAYNKLKPFVQKRGFVKSIMIAAPVLAIVYFAISNKNKED